MGKARVDEVLEAALMMVEIGSFAVELNYSTPAMNKKILQPSI